MTRRRAARLRRFLLEALLAVAGFVYVAATYLDASLALWLVKWRIALALIAAVFLVLSRGRLTAVLAAPIALITGLSLVGLVAQLGENIDSRAVELAAGYMTLAVVALAAAPAALRQRRARIVVFRGLLWGVLAGVLLAVALGIANPLVAFHIDGLRIRFKGYYERPNSAGWYGYVGVVLAVVTALETRRKWILALVPVFLAPVLLANSRGASIALVVLGVCWGAILVRWLSQGWRTAVVASGVVVCLLAFALSPGLVDRLSLPAPDALDELTSGRWSNWERSLSYLDDPVSMGFGLGLSRNLSFTPGNAGLRGGESDNFYVDLIGRTGLLGFGFFLSSVLILGRRLITALQRATPRTAAQRAFCLALFLSGLSYAFVESHLLTAGVLHAVALWSVVGWAATRDEPL